MSPTAREQLQQLTQAAREQRRLDKAASEAQTAQHAAEAKAARVEQALREALDRAEAKWTYSESYNILVVAVRAALTPPPAAPSKEEK